MLENFGFDCDGTVAEIIAEPTLWLGPFRIAFRLLDDVGSWDFARDERRIIRLVPAEKPTPRAVPILQHSESSLRKP